jgi:hypothetical protein
VRDIPARPEDKAIKARRTINASGAGSLQHGEEHALHEIGGEILAAQVAQAVKPDPRPEAPTELCLSLVRAIPFRNAEDDLLVGNILDRH